RMLSLSRFLCRVATLVTRRPKLIFVSSLVLMSCALFVARNVKVNSSRTETYDATHPTMQSLRLVEQELSGLFPLEIELQSDDPDLFYQADFVRKLAAFQRFALNDEDVLFARSYLDLHAEVEPSLRDLLVENPSESLPDLQGTLNTSRIRIQSAEAEMGYSAFVTGDRKQARVMLKIRDEGTYETQKLIDRLNGELQDLFPTGSGVQFQLTGSSYVNTFAMNQLIRELLGSLLGASGVIFLIIVLLFRSFRFGILAVLPNATPLVLTVGYMGWQGYDMNASNVIVFAIALGIAVDDTIHFLFRFRDEHQRVGDVTQAIHLALEGTGRAIILTSFLIVIGLAVLLFSQFIPTRRFGELLIVTMAGALVGDLLLLPTCIILFSKATNITPNGAAGGAEKESSKPHSPSDSSTPDELVSESPS
ncbi:MAG: MMPL family transporter, partial [Planctomycetaceae bacterium]|nr:MMPL family transporter [Planctomycetaceae bacterium]